LCMWSDWLGLILKSSFQTSQNTSMAPLLAHDLAHVQLTTLSGALAVSCARISRGNGALARE